VHTRGPRSFRRPHLRPILPAPSPWSRLPCRSSSTVRTRRDQAAINRRAKAHWNARRCAGTRGWRAMAWNALCRAGTGTREVALGRASSARCHWNARVEREGTGTRGGAWVARDVTGTRGWSAKALERAVARGWRAKALERAGGARRQWNARRRTGRRAGARDGTGTREGVLERASSARCHWNARVAREGALERAKAHWNARWRVGGARWHWNARRHWNTRRRTGTREGALERVGGARWHWNARRRTGTRGWRAKALERASGAQARNGKLESERRAAALSPGDCLSGSPSKKENLRTGGACGDGEEPHAWLSTTAAVSTGRRARQAPNAHRRVGRADLKRWPPDR